MKAKVQDISLPALASIYAFGLILASWSVYGVMTALQTHVPVLVL